MQTGTNPDVVARGLPLVSHRPKIVAVDGPAGSGKSSICSRVCERIGWTYINTGALYRGIGLLAVDAGLDLDDEANIAAMVTEIAPDLKWDAASRRLWYKDRDLTERLDSEKAGFGASKIARHPMVRAALLPIQRDITLAAETGALVDGRDIGTVVFPDADLKIYLTASLEERSRRRLQQLGAAAAEGLEDIMKTLATRDERDGTRSTAPLKQAEDALVLDTSHLDVEATVTAMIQLLRDRGLIP